jgi:hypothetical protein
VPATPFFTINPNATSLGPDYLAILTPSCVTGHIIPQ